MCVWIKTVWRGAMATNLSIEIGGVSFRAELNDSATAGLLREALPLTIRMSRWGDEYYGSCGVSSAAEESAREIMEVGELAFWPPGNALCIFFGPTPASSDDRPRAASEVTPVGRILDDPSPLKGMAGSVDVRIAATE